MRKLQFRRTHVLLIGILFAALFGCQSVSLPKIDAPHPLVIGILVPDANLPTDESLGSAVIWQHEIANYVEQCKVGVRVVSIDPKDPSSKRRDECDIFVQPIVRVTSLGKVSNNSNAILANVAWLTTYFGYFFFADMTVDSPNKLGFRVSGNDERPKLSDSEDVKSPALELSFNDRDQLFTSRFFMGLVLLPALHPLVCGMVGIKPVDQSDTAETVRMRLSGALASGIARFVDTRLVRQQELNKLPHLASLRARVIDKQGALQMMIEVKSATDTPLIPRLSGLVAGKPHEWDAVSGAIPASSPAAQSRQFAFDLGVLAADTKELRLILDEVSGALVSYTITHERLLQLAKSQAADNRN